MMVYSENIDGTECPFKDKVCNSGCAAYIIRYRKKQNRYNYTEEEESYMVCLVLKAIGIDDV